MAQKNNALTNKNTKPSKILALFALFIAILLPYFLVKTFRQTQAIYDNSLLEVNSGSKLNENIPVAEVVKESIKDQTFIPSTIVQEQKIESLDGKQGAQVPAAVSTIPKSETDELQTITTRDGDSLASVFRRLGLRPQTLQALLKDNPHAKTLSGIKPNKQLQVLIHNHVLEKLIFPLDTTQLLIITREGNHYRSEISARKMTSRNYYVTATVQGSLYATAKRKNISFKLIQQMTDIFNWEVDFARDVRVGDQFTILYKALFIENNLVGTGEIIGVTYSSRGKVHQAIRHTKANGDYDYFTPEGNSLKKAFIRYPIKFSHISSTFSPARQHPVLHYKRPHKGVDLAATLGTPVLATGDGRIEIIGRQSGYGNMIKIEHNKTYTSVYAHMLKFQKGLVKGDRIKRGQIIGYVGQTGLATGPHCHYEFHINNQPKNPTTIDLPKGSPVPPREIASFKANAGNLLAQMKLHQEAKLASAGRKISNAA